MMDKQMLIFKQKQMMMANKKREIMEKQKQMLLNSTKLNEYIHIDPIRRSNTSNNEDKDCVVTAWSPWSSQCSSSCGLGGYRSRFRTVVQESVGSSSKPCPRKMERRKKCRLPACPLEDPCSQVSEWGPWSPCPTTCGSKGSQMRRRVSPTPASLLSCPHLTLVEKRACLLSCCPGIAGNC